ncbi:MAG TPA: metallophosphoesterase family protein [Anaerolineae bacterium]|nr:metallophosphoesterase family protein [Anaerolineae bacterium]
MRCLVVSDIHSNLEAFEAVLSHAGPVDCTWCLGDLVGYGPDPNACVDLLRSRTHLCVAGNHDWAALGKLDLTEFNADARLAAAWTQDLLTPANRAFLEALPKDLPWPDTGRFGLVHGSPCHPIWEYILDERSAVAAFRCGGAAYCLHGHTHVPVLISLVAQKGRDRVTWAQPPGAPCSLGPERMLINPGSVGQPRDGDNRASYLILDPDALLIEHRRVEYPYEQTQRKMLNRGLPPRLATRLAFGL